MNKENFQKKYNQELHNIICNKRCNVKVHKEKGFIPSLSILTFSKNIMNQDNDGNKKYINTQSSVI